jgi:nicotinic acid mononucleotide adenylyltransferase
MKANRNIKYNLFIGRYQSPHKGHQEIFNEYLKKGEPVLIAVRNVPIDENNPLPAHIIVSLWREVYYNNPLVEVIVIPDIATVNYGNSIGYEIKEIKVEDKIASISATEIRNQILNDKSDWKEFVDERIHTYLEKAFKNNYGNHKQKE